MSKSLVSIIAIAVVLGGGYFAYTSFLAPSDAPEVPEVTAVEPVATEPVEEAPTEAVTAVEEAVTDAVDAAKAEAEEKIEEIKEDVEQKVEEVKEDLENKVTDAINDLTGGAEQGASDAEATTEEAAQSASDVAGTVVEEAASTGIADLLTPETFDFDLVGEWVQNSDALGLGQKTAIQAALEQAKSNPELLNAVIDQIKGAAGL